MEHHHIISNKFLVFFFTIGRDIQKKNFLIHDFFVSVCVCGVCVYECVIFKLIGRFYVYLFKSQSEAVKMKKHGKHYCLQFLFLISKLWIEICKTITFGYKSQKGQKASFEFNVVVDIFSFFKILNHKSRFFVLYTFA